MKRLLLSAAIAATAAPAWAQVQGDYEQQNKGDNTCLIESEDEVCLIADHSPIFEYSDTVITVANRIGYSESSELTTPTSILTQRDIQNRNQGVVADLLRTVPSLAVSQNGGAGSLTQIRMRGSEANHIVVIIDGVEVANPSDGAFDFGGLRTEDIIKIEILRGEQSALYGSDAIGGVINIITRAGSTSESWSASIEAGSRKTLEGQVSAVIPFGDAALTLNGNVFTTAGFDVSGLGGEKDGAKNRVINIGLNNVEVGAVTFSGKFGSNTRNTDFDTDLPDENFIYDGRLDDSFDASEVTTETARLDARFALAGFDQKLTAHMVETDTDTVGGFSSRTIGSRHVANWAAKREFNDHHSLTALAEVEHEEYEIIGAGTYEDNWTQSLAGDYRYSEDNFTITVSARHDNNDLFDNATTWRVGSGYAFDWNGRLRSSVGTGIKNPTFVELFGYAPNAPFVGNPDLQPEKSIGVSLGYEQSFGNFDISFDIFRSKLENEIRGAGNSVVNLSSDSRREGIEIGSTWTPSDIFSLRGSASFLNSEQDDLEEIRRPKVLASATATWEPIQDVNVTVAADYNGKQLDEDFGDCVYVPSFSCTKIELDSFVLVGANLRYDLTDQVTLTLRGSNLLDETYQEIISYASPGRAVFAGFELDF